MANDYLEARAEQVYQKMIRGEEVPQQEIWAVFQQVSKKLEENNHHNIHMYNKGNEMFYRLSPGTSVAGTPDPLSPSPPEQAKQDVDFAAKQKVLAEKVLARDHTSETPVLTREEVAALKYYALQDAGNAGKVRNFVHTYVRDNDYHLSNANIDDTILSDKRNYYIDQLRKDNRDDYEADRSEGGNSVKLLTDKELCQKGGTDSIVRGHQVAAFLLDMNDTKFTDYMRGQYPHTFEGAQALQNYNAEGKPTSDQSVTKARDEIAQSAHTALCKPLN